MGTNTQLQLYILTQFYTTYGPICTPTHHPGPACFGGSGGGAGSGTQP